MPPARPTAARVLGRSAAGLLAAVAALGVVTSAASARIRSCGDVGKGSSHVAVYVTHGQVGCTTARHIIRVLFHGGGVVHQGSDRAHTYTRIGHWRCGSGTGGGGCSQPHSHPSRQISWAWCGGPDNPAACQASVAAVRPAPVLGRPGPGTFGFGRAHPKSIAVGAAPTTGVVGIHWREWGAARAKGSGRGAYLPPGVTSFAHAKAARARLVAYDLGRCGARRAYRKLKWFFPSRGDTFASASAIDICGWRA